MKIKTKFLSFLILGFLVTSICFSDLSKGVVAPDQLKLSPDSYVKGRFLLTNSTHSDLHLADMTIYVDKIWNTTDTYENIIQITITMEPVIEEGNPLGIDDIDIFEYTSWIFEHNRTTLLPGARIYIGNSTWAIAASVLHHTAIWGIQDDYVDVNVTYEGSTYIYGDVDPLDPIYSDLSGIMFIYAIFNALLLSYFPYTILAISPEANVGDTINYYPSDGPVDAIIPITVGTKSYDTFKVDYVDTMVFGLDEAADNNIFYETKTGLLVRAIEDDVVDNEKREFAPTEIKIKTGLIPYSFVGVIVSLMAIGLLVIYRKKKN